MQDPPSDTPFGPSGAIRTRGFQLPKLAPYRLGYTRKYEVLRLRCYYTTLAVVVKHVVMDRFSREPQGRGNPRDPSKIRASQVLRRRRRIACVHAPKAGALPTGLHPDIVRRNSLHYVSALRRKLHIRSFLLPPRIGPAKLGSNSEKREKKLAALRFRLTAKRPRSSELAYYTSSAGGTQGNFLPAGGACVFSLMFLYNCGILSKGV